MARKTIPTLTIGDEFTHYGMVLKVEALRRFTKAEGYSADVTQAKCRIIEGTIPRAYSDDSEGTHYTVQGNEHATVEVR